MNIFRLCALGTVLLTAISAPATAQLQPARQLAPLHVPIHTAADDEGMAYGIWGAAESYKASFHDGMTFVPYLGTDYPHNQPWSWRTVSATVGGVPLFEPGAVAARVQGEHRYAYRFAGVTEAYDVRVDGLEQTFVVHQLPARGDLVITGEVTSLLRAPRSEAAQQALTFVDDRDTPIVGYGEAWAFDANGSRTPVTTSSVDGRIALTVPGDWLARAALPVVVHPLLTRVQVASGLGPSIRTVDIGRDNGISASNVMVVSVYAASQFDGDIYARLCNDDYSSAAVVFSDITTSWDSDGASCAFVGGAYRWAIVFRRYFAQSPLRVSRLRCHVHDSASTVASTTVSGLATPTGLNDWRPDVGGVENYRAGSSALVVFQREDNSNTAGHWANVAESRVWAVLVDATSTYGAFGTPFPVLSTAGTDIERPSVNQVAEGGSAFSWVCAMQAYANGVSMDDWDVLVRRIENTGALSPNVWSTQLASQNTRHQLGPVVAGRAGRYAVAFATATVASQPTKSSNIRGTSLWVQRLDWEHGAPQYPASQPAVELISGVDRSYESGCIAYDTRDESHFAIGCRTIGTAQPAAICMRVGFQGQITEAPTFLHSAAGTSTSPVACTFAYHLSSFLFAYGVAGGIAEPTYGHTLAYVAVADEQAGGFGCNNASIRWFGNQQIGSEFETLAVLYASPSSLHAMLVSLAPIDVPFVLPVVDPGCRLLVDAFGPGYIGILPTRTGVSATWQLPLPEVFTPTTLYFQDWMLDNGTLSSTQRLTVPIVK